MSLRENPSGLRHCNDLKYTNTLCRYVDKYECPQIFCWDGQTLLMLQFRARKASQLREVDCPVDCWVIPATESACTLRYALYRLMVQGFRRCQARASEGLVVAGLAEHGREFFTGKPIWKFDGKSQLNHPGGYIRAIDESNGALKWVHEEDPEVTWETGEFW